MQRAALAANRSLDVLSFLAANPSQGHTLTELARGLGVNPSSMHGILAVMTDSGFLLRHSSHKTYRLGPMAAAVGQASYEQNPSIDLARQELARLADEFDLQAAVVASIDDAMIVVGRHGPATGEFLTFVGQRVLHAPPFGSIFAAWAPRNRASQWLQAAEPPLDERRPTRISACSRSFVLRAVPSSWSRTGSSGLRVPASARPKRRGCSYRSSPVAELPPLLCRRAHLQLRR